MRLSSPLAGVVIFVGIAVSGCASAPAGTPPVSPGTDATPREVTIIARDYAFVPSSVDLVPGERILLHVINGGLDIHEAVIGAGPVQDAWEAAEAAATNPPPGPTPLVSVPLAVAGLRVVVRSGERVDVLWTVPPTAAGVTGLVVGCHIPGHWARGMQVPVRIARLATAG